METRKVGKLGAASLVVSLPADWVRLTGIRKGDDVYVYPHGLSLVVTPREQKRDRGEAVVDVVDAHGAVISIFARYVQGFDSIRLVAGKASKKEVDDVLDAVDSHLLGVEVLSQSRDGVTLQVFTREQASLPQLFKRLRFVIKSLSALLIQEMRGARFDSAQIKTLTKSAFKLYFLTLRLVYGASRGSRALAESKLSFSELISFALCAKNIGGILDAVNKVVRSYDDLNAGFEQNADLIGVVERAVALYSRCLTAFLENERLDFGEVRRERRNLIVAASASFGRASGLMEEEARVLRNTQSLAHDLADRAGELMELEANAEGFK